MLGVPIKAVACDIDGTITDAEGRLSCRAVEALRRLEEQGIMTILISGNALCVVKTLKRYIGTSGPVVAENGGVVEYRGVLKRLGSRSLAEAALKLLKEKFGERIEESWSNRYRYVDLAIKRSLPVEEMLPLLPSSVKLLDSGYAYHLIDAEVDKGKGLLKAAAMAGIRAEYIVAVGDSAVDQPMLEAAGWRAVVGNAPLELKQIAHYVASREYGEGFEEIAGWILKSLV